MSSKILLIFALLGATSFADATETIASYRFAFVNSSQVAGVEPTETEFLSFDDNSVRVEAILKRNRVLRLKIQKIKGGGEGPPVGPQRVFKRKLSIGQYNDLFNKVTQLSNSKIENTYSDFVCMMLPPASLANDHLKVKRDYEYNSYSFNGSLKLISTPTGCWLGDKVYPKSDESKNLVHGLKAAIKAVALGYVGR